MMCVCAWRKTQLFVGILYKSTIKWAIFSYVSSPLRVLRPTCSGGSNLGTTFRMVNVSR